MRVIEQAGAIIGGLQNGEPATLLVTGKRNPGHWIFPKGHVERGESLADTALREAEEEAGVRGTLLGPAGVLSFVERGHTVRVHYFVVVTRDAGSPELGRRIRWFPLDAALQHLTFDDSRSLLREAWPAIVTGTSRPPSGDSSRPPVSR